MIVLFNNEGILKNKNKIIRNEIFQRNAPLIMVLYDYIMIIYNHIRITFKVLLF